MVLGSGSGSIAPGVGLARKNYSVGWSIGVGKPPPSPSGNRRIRPGRPFGALRANPDRELPGIPGPVRPLRMAPTIATRSPSGNRRPAVAKNQPGGCRVRGAPAGQVVLETGPVTKGDKTVVHRTGPEVGGSGGTYTTVAGPSVPFASIHNRSSERAGRPASAVSGTSGAEPTRRLLVRQAPTRSTAAVIRQDSCHSAHSR
jgi:hypothetical protein